MFDRYYLKRGIGLSTLTTKDIIEKFLWGKIKLATNSLMHLCILLLNLIVIINSKDMNYKETILS